MPALDIFSERQSFERFCAAAVFIAFFSILVLPELAEALWFRPLNFREVLTASLLCSGPALAGALLLAATKLKGRAWFAVGMLEATLVAVPLVPFAGYWTFLGVNCGLDRGTPTEYTARVLKTYIDRGKSSTSCGMLIKSWRAGHSTEDLKIPCDVYEGLQHGSNDAVVMTKPGALGHPWVLDVRFVAAP